jgi:transcriptional regulator with XRE-family HTH domain
MTQEALAASASCDARTIRNAEQGNRLDVVTLKRIAQALDMQYADIVRQLDEANGDVRLKVPIAREWLSAFDDRDAKATRRVSIPLHIPADSEKVVTVHQLFPSVG